MSTRTLPVMMAATALAAIAIGSAARGSAAQDPREVKIETIKVTESVYMLIGPQSGNIGLCVGRDGNFMIDDQYAHHTGPILQAAAAVNDDPIRFLVNTHWHGDHTGGNENMAGEGALIVAHENVRVRMSADQFMSAFNNTVPASPEAARPVITFTESMTFHWNGDAIHIFHVANAHTDGDAIIHFRSNNVIHMGDTFFNGFYPFIDVGSGGSIDGVIAAADKVLAMADPQTRIIPGHGPLATSRELRTYRDMLRAVRQNVQTLVRHGKTREETIAAKPSADYDEAWGSGFMNPETFIGLVYDSLAQPTP